jgi:predicted RNA-binding protein YlqC (UPF0109 family)/cold shock CspA family protein
MEELIKRITQAIVDNPDEVSVKKREGGSTTFYELRVAEEDTGKVIGKRGLNIEAIRTILAGVSAKKRIRCVLKIVNKSHANASRTPSEKQPAAWHPNSSEKSTGIVTWFNDIKGYGFITMEGGADVFMRRSSIRGGANYTLVEGDRVTFQVIQDDKGLKAINVAKTGAQF